MIICPTSKTTLLGLSESVTYSEVSFLFGVIFFEYVSNVQGYMNMQKGTYYSCGSFFLCRSYKGVTGTINTSSIYSKENYQIENM